MGFKSAQSLFGILWFPQFLQVLVFQLLKQLQRSNGQNCYWAPGGRVATRIFFL